MRANNREKELDKQPTKLVDTMSGAANHHSIWCPVIATVQLSIISFFGHFSLVFTMAALVNLVAMALVGRVWRP